MRRWTPVLILGMLVLVLGTQTVQVASAGNYTHQTVKYYSVALFNGQYFYSTDASRIILVDDITYAVPRYTPCNTVTACDFFTVDLLPLNWIDMGYGSPYDLPVWPQVVNIWGWRSQSTIAMTSYVAGFDVALQDADGTGEDAFMFDEHTITTYGQLSFAHSLTEDGFEFWDYGGGGGGLSTGEPILHSMYANSLVTSDSRHYQSPHIVQYGRVYCNSTLGNPTVCTVFIKGRTVSNTDPNRPVIDTGITVVTP